MGLRSFFVSLILIFVMAGVSCATNSTVLTVGGTGSGLGVMRLLGQNYNSFHPEVSVNVLPSLGSAGGIRALKDGAIDLAISSRLLHEKEKAGIIGYLLGRSPFVFVVHPATQVDDVTENQLAGIYSGNITTWQDGVQIRRIIRPVADTDWQIMRTISPEVAEALDGAQETSGLFLAVTDSDVLSYIERVHGSFGAATLAMILAEKRRVKILSFDGIQPGTAVSGTQYPLEKQFIILMRDNTSANVRDFIDFIFSDRGKSILAQVGITAARGPGRE